MGQLKFGVSSMNLGKAVNKEPDREIRDENGGMPLRSMNFSEQAAITCRSLQPEQSFYGMKKIYIFFLSVRSLA